METDNVSEEEKREMHNQCIQCALELLKLGADLGNEVSREVFEKENADSDFFTTASEQLKSIIGRIGWPTVNKVGEQSAKTACAIVLGSTHDFPFQESCLSLMINEPAGQVPTRLLANLVDMVRVRNGKQQVYGTQAAYIGGKKVVFPVEDPATLAKRREQMGFPTDPQCPPKQSI